MISVNARKLLVCGGLEIAAIAPGRSRLIYGSLSYLHSGVKVTHTVNLIFRDVMIENLNTNFDERQYAELLIPACATQLRGTALQLAIVMGKNERIILRTSKIKKSIYCALEIFSAQAN